jgi:hypothetical protein
MAGRKRATAQEVVQQERRRRVPGTLDRGQHLKLAIPEPIREANPGQSFRWMNDEGNKMYFRTVQDDWNKVPGVEPIPVGTDAAGKPILAHLCMKKQEWFDADQKEKVDQTRQRERAIVEAKKADPEDDRPDEVSYVVPGNSIGAFTP